MKPIKIPGLALVALALVVVVELIRSSGESPQKSAAPVVAPKSSADVEAMSDEIKVLADNPRGRSVSRECPTEGVTMISENAKTIVFRKQNETLVCDKQSNTWHEFLASEYVSDVEVLELSGSFLIADGHWGCPDLCEFEPHDLALYDASTGDVQVLEEDFGIPVQRFRIGSVALTEGGTVVYAVRRTTEPKDEDFYEDEYEKPQYLDGVEVVKFSAETGKRQVLASGNGIDLRSVALNGSTFTWASDGRTNSTGTD